MFTLIYAKNPIYTDTTGNAITLTVRFEEFLEEMLFNACSYDPEPHGVDLYNRAKAEEFGNISAYIKPSPPADQPQATGMQTI